MPAQDIRFGLQAGPEGDPNAWLDLAKQAEDAGFDALYVADHLGATASPFPALAVAAGATSRLRLGTYVLNAGVRDPMAIASDAATLDTISGGRLVLGLGAGHTPAEWTMTGREYPSAAARVGRLEETVDVVVRLLEGDVVTHHGRYLDLDDASLPVPRPVQQPVPLLIGGNGPRVLALGGRRAETVSVTGTGRTLPDGHKHEVDWTDAAIRASVARRGRGRARRARAGTRRSRATRGYHRRPRRRRRARRVPVAGASAADVLGSPFVLLGTLDQLAEEVVQHHERFGFTSYVVRAGAFDAIAALIERLRGN